MFWDQKNLFDASFFESALGVRSKKEFAVRYFLTDSRAVHESQLSCFLGIKGDTFDGSDYALQAYEQGVRVFVLGKKVPLPKDACVFIVSDVQQALAKLASYHRTRLMIPHVLITGSVGKTTTRQLCLSVLQQKYKVHTAKKNFNNEIGLPLSVLETAEDARASILEAGMNHSGEIGRLSQIVRPEIAIITNVHLIHAGPLGSLEAIADAKAEITEGMNESSILFINEDEPFAEKFIQQAKGEVRYFRPSALHLVHNLGDEGFTFRHDDYDGIEFLCPLAGLHLRLNLAIVFALAKIFNVPGYLIKQGLEEVPPLPERMNFLQKGKTKLIADCYNASLASFKAALDVLKESGKPRTAIIGDILEMDQFTEQVHEELMAYIIAEDCADCVWVHGLESIKAAQVLKGQLPIQEFPVLETLKNNLPSLYKEGGTVLIKASHGMKFANLLD